MGAAPNTGLRVVVRDAKGNEHLRSIDELLCSERAAAEDHADYDRRVLAAIRQGIDTEGPLLEIIGGQRKDIRASLVRHLEAGHIADAGGTFTVAKPTTRAKPSTRASKPKSRAKSEATVEAKSEPKAKPKEKAEPPKVQAKAKASNTPKPRKPKAKKAKKPKAAKEPAFTPEKRAEYDAATLRAVEGGALTNSAVRKKIGGTVMQVVAALTRLVADDKLVLVEEGPPARYKPATAVPAKSTAASKKLPKLTWRSTSTRGRKGYTAAWDVGVFKMFATKSGSFALFYQKDGADKYEEYGCGPSREVKKQARMIAAAGVPSAEQWHAQGGELLGDCPVAVRRVTKSKSATLTWTDTIQDGRQVCVAPTTDGEFKMESTKGGSFALIFVRDGDATGESLGTGKKATLLKRALEIVDEEAKETAASDDDRGDTDDTDDTGDADDTDDADGTGDDDTDDQAGDDTDDEVAEPPAPQVQPDNAGQAGNDAQMMSALMGILGNL